MIRKVTIQVFICAMFLSCALFCASAHAADCTDPDYEEGTVVYNLDYHVLQYCNGSYWVAAASTTGGGGGALVSDVEVVGANCGVNTCTATCPGSKTIIFALGWHGDSYNLQDDITSWACGAARSWMGACVGQSSCTRGAGCASTGVYILCQ